MILFFILAKLVLGVHSTGWAIAASSPSFPPPNQDLCWCSVCSFRSWETFSFVGAQIRCHFLLQVKVSLCLSLSTYLSPSQKLSQSQLLNYSYLLTQLVFLSFSLLWVPQGQERTLIDLAQLPLPIAWNFICGSYILWMNSYILWMNKQRLLVFYFSTLLAQCWHRPHLNIALGKKIQHSQSILSTLQQLR